MFGRGFILFRLLGFEVRLDWSWLLLGCLLTWTLARGVFPSSVPGLLSSRMYWWMGVAGALGLFVSILLHEFGHAVAARRYGIPMRGITLFVFGGVHELEGEPPSPRSEALMAIAGPVMSIILGSVGFVLRRLSEVWHWPLAATGFFAYLGVGQPGAGGVQLDSGVPAGWRPGAAFRFVGG